MEKFAEEENGFLRVKVFDNPKKNKQLAGILPLKIPQKILLLELMHTL